MSYHLHHPEPNGTPPNLSYTSNDVIASYFAEPLEWIMERIKGTASRRATYGLSTGTLYLSEGKRIVATIHPTLTQP
jgi:hypothetical protein